MKRINSHFFVVFFAVAIIFPAVSSRNAFAQDKCLPVTDTMKKDLTQYVQKKFKLPTTLTLSVAEASPVGDTCYRKLRFEGSNLKQPVEFELFLSPDRRFLSRDLSDSRLDPVVEEAKKTEQLQRGLAKTGAPALGSKDAPVTVVVFSDFECPFCKRSAAIIKELATTEGKNVRFVFRHLPLRMHPWARLAAEATACVQLQSEDAFWRIHDLVFENQQVFTAENVASKVLEFAQTIPGLDLAKLQTCLVTRASSSTVAEDVRFASAIDVAATPTFFINGSRAQGIKSADQLRALIRGHVATTDAKDNPPLK